MSSPVSASKIPTIAELRLKLGYGDGQLARVKSFSDDVRVFSKRFITSNGLRGSELVVWRSPEHKSGLREMTNAWLESLHMGETYWPTDPAHPNYNKLQFSAHGQKIKELVAQLFFKVNNNASQNIRYKSFHRKKQDTGATQYKGSSDDPIEIETPQQSDSLVQSSEPTISSSVEQHDRSTPLSANGQGERIVSSNSPFAQSIGERLAPAVSEDYTGNSNPEGRSLQRKIVVLKLPKKRIYESTLTDAMDEPENTAQKRSRRKETSRKENARSESHRHKSTAYNLGTKRKLPPRSRRRPMMPDEATAEELDAICSPAPKTTTANCEAKNVQRIQRQGEIMSDEDAPGEEVNPPACSRIDAEDEHLSQTALGGATPTSAVIEPTYTSPIELQNFSSDFSYRELPELPATRTILPSSSAHIEEPSSSMPTIMNKQYQAGTQTAKPNNSITVGTRALEVYTVPPISPLEQSSLAEEAVGSEALPSEKCEQTRQVRSTKVSATILYAIILSRAPYYRRIPWLPRGSFRSKTFSELTDEIPLELSSMSKGLLFTLSGPQLEIQQVVSRGQENEFEHLKMVVAQAIQRNVSTQRKDSSSDQKPVFELTIEEMTDTIVLGEPHEGHVEFDF